MRFQARARQSRIPAPQQRARPAAAPHAVLPHRAGGRRRAAMGTCRRRRRLPRRRAGGSGRSRAPRRECAAALWKRCRLTAPAERGSRPASCLPIQQLCGETRQQQRRLCKELALIAIGLQQVLCGTGCTGLPLVPHLRWRRRQLRRNRHTEHRHHQKRKRAERRLLHLLRAQAVSLRAQ